MLEFWAMIQKFEIKKKMQKKFAGFFNIFLGDPKIPILRDKNGKINGKINGKYAVTYSSKKKV